MQKKCQDDFFKYTRPFYSTKGTEHFGTGLYTVKVHMNLVEGQISFEKLEGMGLRVNLTFLNAN